MTAGTICRVAAAILALAAVASPAAPNVRAGATYTYACSDLSREVVRSNAGAAMRDFMLLAGSSCLSPGAAITVRNADRKAWLYLYGTLIEHPHGIERGYNSKTGYATFIEGGVPLGGGCAQCLSVAFVAPGATATFVYDGTTTGFPNGTIGNCRACPVDRSVRAQIWRLGRHDPGLLLAGSGPLPLGRGTRPPEGGFGALSGTQQSAGWHPYRETACCSCVPFTLWGAPWRACNGGAGWALNTRSAGGGDILRLELRQGDHWWNERAQGRWEIERTMAQGRTVLSNGKTYWEAWSFKWECGAPVGSDVFARGSYWLLIEDIHSSIHTPGAVVPIQTELLPGGYLALNLRTQNGYSQNYVYISPRPLVCGVWHDVVRRFDIDPAAGAFDEWLDGVRIANFNGPLGNAGDAPYAQFQLYRADYYGSAATHAEQIANYTLGTASSAARIAAPPPMP